MDGYIDDDAANFSMKITSHVFSICSLRSLSLPALVDLLMPFPVGTHFVWIIIDLDAIHICRAY